MPSSIPFQNRLSIDRKHLTANTVRNKYFLFDLSHRCYGQTFVKINDTEIKIIWNNMTKVKFNSMSKFIISNQQLKRMGEKVLRRFSINKNNFNKMVLFNSDKIVYLRKHEIGLKQHWRQRACRFVTNCLYGNCHIGKLALFPVPLLKTLF